MLRNEIIQKIKEHEMSNCAVVTLDAALVVHGVLMSAKKIDMVFDIPEFEGYIKDYNRLVFEDSRYELKPFKISYCKKYIYNQEIDGIRVETIKGIYSRYVRLYRFTGVTDYLDKAERLREIF